MAATGEPTTSIIHQFATYFPFLNNPLAVAHYFHVAAETRKLTSIMGTSSGLNFPFPLTMMESGRIWFRGLRVLVRSLLFITFADSCLSECTFRIRS